MVLTVDLFGEPANSKARLVPGLFYWADVGESTARYYCGQTGDVVRRLRQHNDPDYYLSKTTKRFQGPWKLLWSHECPDRGTAMKLERSIKKRGIRRFLEKARSV